MLPKIGTQVDWPCELKPVAEQKFRISVAVGLHWFFEYAGPVSVWKTIAFSLRDRVLRGFVRNRVRLVAMEPHRFQALSRFGRTALARVAPRIFEKCTGSLQRNALAFCEGGNPQGAYACTSI